MNVLNDLNCVNRIHLQKPDVGHFVNYCLMGGATVVPIDINIGDPMWPGCCNPSIMWDEKTQDFKLVIRNVNHVLHGVDEPIKAPTQWGPVLYSIPTEDGRNLKTRNYIGTSKDPATEQWKMQPIETTPYKPIWEFQGEEDARIVRWDDKIYTTGVRRDDNKDGRGRMELMHLSEKGYREVTRTKVKAVNEDSYCEKNWMPIKDMPFHYIQQTNPTVVVRTDPKTGDTVEVVHKERMSGLVDERFDLLRGSSQVIRWRGHWLTLVHTCEMWLTANNRKYSRYCHCFVMWDDDWNIVKISPLFSFADYNIEFTCGLEIHDGKFYIPFAIEDNFSYLITVDEDVIDRFIHNDASVQLADSTPAAIYSTGYVQPYLHIFRPMPERTPYDQHCLFEAGMWYYRGRFLAATYDIMIRSIEMFDYTYNERFMAARAIADLSHRDGHEIGMWMWAIMHDPSRPEAYMGTAMYYYCRGAFAEALYHASRAMENLKNYQGDLVFYSRQIMEQQWIQILMDSPYYNTAVQWMDTHNIKHENDRRVL